MKLRKVLILFLVALVILPGLALACDGSTGDTKNLPAPSRGVSGDKAGDGGSHNNGANIHGARNSGARNDGTHDELNLPAGGNHPCPVSQRYETWWGNKTGTAMAVNRTAGTSGANKDGGHGLSAPAQGNVPSPLPQHNESWWSNRPGNENTVNGTASDEARIAALEKQVMEQNQELERQGNILTQIMNLLERLFGWKT